MEFDRSAARFTVAALVAADAAFVAARTAFVSMYAPPAAWDAHWAECHAARELVLAEEAKLAGLLCGKCDGKGSLLGYSHRSNGLCYRCNGDGWTAKGRKAERARLAAQEVTS